MSVSQQTISGTVAPSILCKHCGLPVVESVAEFCCVGCQTVYETIHALGLTDFYRYRPAQGLPVTNQSSDSNFSCFDDAAFVASSFARDASGILSGTISISGIYCAGCIWILEALPKILPGVLVSRANLASGSLDLIFDPSQISLSRIAKQLERLGYRVHERVTQQRGVGKNTYHKAMLLRLGVAGICAANTMMLACSLWEGIATGIESEFESLFRWISLLLTVPVIFYSATPFFVNAWYSLKAKRLHIDIPIALVLGTSFLASVVNTIVGRPHVYFDSITSLVFLLLTGRFVQERALLRARAQTKQSWSLLPQIARVVSEGEYSLIAIEEISPDMLCEVRSGERIPADGTIIKGSAAVDTSVLTGESIPQVSEVGSQVLASTLCASGTIQIKIEKTGSETRIGRILEALDSKTTIRTPFTEMTDLLSRYFLWLLLFGATVVFGFVAVSTDLWVAFDRTLALLVITCPCALGLAAPLTLTTAIGQASKQGILIREAQSLEKIPKVRHIFFDKTGTLTKGTYEVVGIKSVKPTGNDSVPSILSALSEVSAFHPITNAIGRWALKNNVSSIALYNSVTIPSRGVQAIDADNSEWSLGSIRWCQERGIVLASQALEADESSVAILCKNNIHTSTIYLADQIKPGASLFITKLKGQGIKISILSGDSTSLVQKIGATLGVSREACFGDLSPQEKASIVERCDDMKMFVGDGVNDCLAMKVSDISVGVSGGIEANVEVADTFLTDGTFQQIESLWTGAHQTVRVIKKSLLYSLAYNIVFAPLAAIGLVNPIVASVVMPVSSLHVVLSSTLSKIFKKQ